MITRRHFSTGVLASVAMLPTLAKAQADRSPPGRSEEVDALRRFAETTHPRGREAAADADWQRRWSTLRDEAGRLHDGAYFIATRRALGWFGDGHTTVLPFEFVGGVPAALQAGPFGTALPLQVRLFHDGAYVTAASGAAAPLLGRALRRIGALDAAELVRQVAVQWPGNAAWAHRWAGSALASPAFLEGFGAVENAAAPIPYDAGGPSTRISPVRGESPALAPLARRRTAREGWAEAAGGNYVRPLPERRALYFSIDEMDDTPARSFEILTREGFAAMEQAGAERLIVDLRRNGGGNNYLGEPLRKRIAASRFNRPGALYVLIGPPTFSAAQNLANRLERETWAIFVGEPTGGAPNHYGDARPFAGPATGLTSLVSTIPWFDSYPQDERSWILPDLPVPALYSDWRDGRDAALETALTHRAATNVDELNRDRIFYFRRASQRVEWRPFWRDAGANAG